MAKRNPAPEGTRESIRKTASALFKTGGIFATSLQDIADAANISKGTLYYHYPTKEILVTEIAELYCANITRLLYAWIDSITQETAAQEAIESLYGTLGRDSSSMRLYFAFMSEALRDEGALRILIRKKQKEWAIMLEVGALKVTDEEASRFRAFSRGYFSLLDGYALHRLLDDTVDETYLNRLLKN